MGWWFGWADDINRQTTFARHMPTLFPTQRYIYGLMFILLVACASAKTETQVDLKDGGFISDEPCAAPCFFQITPGTTTQSEILPLLQTYALDVDCEGYDRRPDGGIHGITCPSAGFIISLNEQDTVFSIGFKPSTEITVAEIIAKYGAPDYVELNGGGSPESDNPVVTSLHYGSIRTVLRLAIVEYPPYVCPSTVVSTIVYVDEAQYERWLALMTRNHSEILWEGYGTYPRR